MKKSQNIQNMFFSKYLEKSKSLFCEIIVKDQKWNTCRIKGQSITIFLDLVFISDGLTGFKLWMVQIFIMSHYQKYQSIFQIEYI